MDSKEVIASSSSGIGAGALASPLLSNSSSSSSPSSTAAGVSRALAGVPFSNDSRSFALETPLEPLARTEQYMLSAAGWDQKVNTIRWKAPSGVVGAVLLVHGWEHYCAAHLDYLAAHFHRIGLASFGIEYIGHGKSEGVRGYVPSLEVLLKDVVGYAQVIKARFLAPNTPLFILGESMGGAIAMISVLRAPAGTFDGATLLCPMVEVDPAIMPHPFVVWVAKAMACALPQAPLAPVENVLPRIFRDKTRITLEEEDPYRYRGRSRLATAMTGLDILGTLGAHSSRISLPFAIFHGLGDRLTSPAASETAFRQAKSQDKTLFQYELAEHAILSDSLDTKQRFLDDIMTWLEDRTAPGRKETTTAALPINAGAIRPPGPEVFSAPGNPLNVFDLATRPEIYSSSHPRNETEVLPAQNALLTVL